MASVHPSAIHAGGAESVRVDIHGAVTAEVNVDVVPTETEIEIELDRPAVHVEFPELAAGQRKANFDRPAGDRVDDQNPNLTDADASGS